jgi:hypothetical protein
MMSAAHLDASENLEDFVSPLVILQRRPVAAAPLSPFEQYVLDNIDGVRSVHEIRYALRLSEADMQIAVALLAEKHAVERAAP